MPYGHFEVAYFLYDNVLGFLLLGENGIIKLSDKSPHDIHGGDAGFEVVVVGEIEDFVDQVFGDVRLETVA